MTRLLVLVSIFAVVISYGGVNSQKDTKISSVSGEYRQAYLGQTFSGSLLATSVITSSLLIPRHCEVHYRLQKLSIGNPFYVACSQISTALQVGLLAR